MPILRRHIENVFVCMDHAADPEHALSGNKKKFVTGHAGPFRRFTLQQASLVIKNRRVGVDLFAAALSLDHRFHELQEFLARTTLNAKTIERIGMNQADLRGYPP